jgi:hypothetical protein
MTFFIHANAVTKAREKEFHGLSHFSQKDPGLIPIKISSFTYGHPVSFSVIVQSNVLDAISIVIHTGGPTFIRHPVKVHFAECTSPKGGVHQRLHPFFWPAKVSMPPLLKRRFPYQGKNRNLPDAEPFSSFNKQGIIKNIVILCCDAGFRFIRT